MRAGIIWPMQDADEKLLPHISFYNKMVSRDGQFARTNVFIP